jgi:hypothetical protein
MKAGRNCAGRKRGGLEELDSKGGDVGGNVSGDEAAAWRDLIARFDLPADVDPAHVPWPDAENLSDPATAPQPSGALDQDQPTADRREQRPADPRERRPADSTDVRPADSRDERPPDPRDVRPADLGHKQQPADGNEQQPADAHRDRPVAGTDHAPWEESARERQDRARVIRPAAPGQQPPAEADDDTADTYIPPPPPPLPSLDPVTKGAWTALAGGPAYLLVATIAGWQIPGWAALLAVIAFITGFTLIVLRMTDKRPEDDDNDGAVL